MHFQLALHPFKQLSTTPGHSIFQAEHDYLGRDYSVNVRVGNPSPADLTGIYTASLIQSVTKSLAVGVEAMFQRPQPGLSDLGLQYYAKYTSPVFTKEQGWIATAMLQPQGMLHTTYWQKLSEKFEVAAELQVVNVPQRRDAIATIAAKWDLRMASFRAQLDSSGKVSALLEQRFAPSFAFLFSGEIDHFKVSKLSFSVLKFVANTDDGYAELCEGRRRCDDRERSGEP